MRCRLHTALVSLATVASLAVVPAPPSARAHVADPPSATAAPWWPRDLPLDGDGVPTRPLDDGDLFRLLTALSARNPAATALLTHCHAVGTPHWHPGWRACVLGPERIARERALRQGEPSTTDDGRP